MDVEALTEDAVHQPPHADFGQNPCMQHTTVSAGVQEPEAVAAVRASPVRAKQSIHLPLRSGSLTPSVALYGEQASTSTSAKLAPHVTGAARAGQGV